MRAKFKLLLKNNKPFANFLSDRFYHPDEWPSYILEIILSDDFGYVNRLKLACFFYGNGMCSATVALHIYKFFIPHIRQLGPAIRHDRDWIRRSAKFESTFKYIRTYVDPSFKGDIHYIYYYYKSPEHT